MVRRIQQRMHTTTQGVAVVSKGNERREVKKDTSEEQEVVAHLYRQTGVAHQLEQLPRHLHTSPRNQSGSTTAQPGTALAALDHRSMAAAHQRRKRKSESQHQKMFTKDVGNHAQATTTTHSTKTKNTRTS
jgi:hypothetical protein